jgi:hypothetical protein
MASSKALGSALSYNPFLPADQNAKRYEIQQQQALASALLGQGLSPIDTNNRMMGQIAYSVSPLESAGKLAQTLYGLYGTKDAAKSYAEMLNLQTSAQANPSDIANMQEGGTGYNTQATGAFGLPTDIAQIAAQAYESDPSAALKIISDFRSPTEQQKNFGNQFPRWVENQTNPVMPNMTVGGREGVPLRQEDALNLGKSMIEGVQPPISTNQQNMQLIQPTPVSTLNAPQQTMRQIPLAPTQDALNAQIMPAIGSLTPQEQANIDVRKAVDSKAGESSISKFFDKDMMEAEQARSGIVAIQDARQALKSGMFTGATADWQLNLVRYGKAAGLVPEYMDEKIANTEVFSSSMGRQVLSLVKNLGAGSGISDADREYAAEVAGGRITLNDQSIDRLLNIGEKAYEYKINQFNNKYEDMKKKGINIPYNLSISKPDPMPQSPPATSPVVRKTIGGKNYYKQGDQWYSE